MADSCATCFFYLGGACHFNAPRLGRFPSVEPGDWCGEGADLSSGISFKTLVNSATAWQDFSPSVIASVGSITSFTATGRYFQQNKLINLEIAIDIITNGTGSNTLECSLPVNPHNIGTFAAVERTLNKGFTASIQGSLIVITKPDGTYPAVDGTIINLGGAYEAA